MGEFVKKGDKYFRNNSDGTLTQVTPTKDGYFTWVLPDSKKVRSLKKYKISFTQPKQEESFLSKLGRWFTDISLQGGDPADVAVKRAAGIEKDKDENWTQNPYTPGATQLRDNLAVISATALPAAWMFKAPSAAVALTPLTVMGGVGLLPWWQTMIGNFAGTMATGMTADEVSRRTTGKSVGGNVRSAVASSGGLGKNIADLVPEFAWEFANPFYLFNPQKITKNVYTSLVNIFKPKTALVISPNSEYLNKYLSLIQSPRKSGTFTGKRSPQTKPLADYMESIGVDSSYFTEEDLYNMIARRRNSVIYPKTRPEGKFTTIEETRLGVLNIPELDITVYDDYSPNGTLLAHQISTKEPDLMIDGISKYLGTNKGFSEAAYNAALTYTQQNGLRGIRSGDELLSPEITYKVWEHYPDKLLLGRYGEHIFNNGRDVTIVGKRKTILDGPVYRIFQPSKPIPTKHLNVFHPDVITENGRIQIPFWENPNIYKVVIPLVLGGTALKESK